MDDGGINMWEFFEPTVHGTPQPPFDPDEPWTELPELKKVAPFAMIDLGEALRKAGVPVTSSRIRRAGLMSGGKVNVVLAVPERLRSEAMSVIEEFPGVSF